MAQTHGNQGFSSKSNNQKSNSYQHDHGEVILSNIHNSADHTRGLPLNHHQKQTAEIFDFDDASKQQINSERVIYEPSRQQ